VSLDDPLTRFTRWDSGNPFVVTDRSDLDAHLDLTNEVWTRLFPRACVTCNMAAWLLLATSPL
jgi:hypothetical protein